MPVQETDEEQGGQGHVGLRNADTDEVTQKFLTLKKLQRRSYYELSEEQLRPREGDTRRMGSTAAALEPFYQHLCMLVRLGNLEVILMRNIGLAAEEVIRKKSAQVVAGFAAERNTNAEIETARTCFEFQSLKCYINRPVNDWTMYRHELEGVACTADSTSSDSLNSLREEIRQQAEYAKSALVMSENAFHGEVDSAVYIKVVEAFGAYSAADMLGSRDCSSNSSATAQPAGESSDEGSQSGLMTWSELSELLTDTDTPERLAQLAIEFLDILRSRNVASTHLAFVWRLLFKAACQSGNSELVKKLLPSTNPTQNSTDIQYSIFDQLELLSPLKRNMVAKAFSDAWVEYETGGKKPWQDGDWLDDKNCGDLAKAIASTVIIFLLRSYVDSTNAVGGQMLEGTEWCQLKKDLGKRPASCQPVVHGLLDLAERLDKITKEKGFLPKTAGGIAWQKLTMDDSGNTVSKAVSKTRVKTCEDTSATLVIEACDMAINAHSLETVEKAFGVLETSERMWSSLSIGLISKLADRYPHHAVSLLNNISQTRLPEVTFDNVLPLAIKNGSYTVTVSNRDFGKKTGFGPLGHSISNKDSDYFSTMNDDEIIEAVLVRQSVAWFGFFFLFDFIREANNKTVRRLRHIWWHAVLSFSMQGPGSLILGTLLSFVALVAGILTTVFEFALTLPFGIGCVVCLAFKSYWRPMNRVSPETSSGSSVSRTAGWVYTTLNTPHYKLVNLLLGWNVTSTAVTCRQMPIPVDFNKLEDTALLRRLLEVRHVPPSIFGSQVLRPIICYKWHYFTKQVVIMQLTLHLIDMVAFIFYAWTIKNMQPLEGSREGEAEGDRIWGYAGSDSCVIPAPTFQQFVLLIVFGTITIDFVLQEIRQICYFRRTYLRHAWDCLDAISIILMMCIISGHFVCALGPLYLSSEALRAMAAVQVLLLFMRLFYYAMAFEELGAFVSMVLATARRLVVFAVFLVVVFVGFALAMIVAQGSATLGSSDIAGNLIMKLFTLMYADNVYDFMDNPNMSGSGDEAHGAAPIITLLRVFISFFMLMVALILFNLLIAIVNNSYDDIRTYSQWVSYRNKAMLIVSTEALLRGFGPWWLFVCFSRKCFPHFTRWLYHNPTMDGSDEKMYLYVIRPEYPHVRSKDSTLSMSAVGEDDNQKSKEGWSGRVAEMKRLIDDQGCRTQSEIDMIIEKLKRLANEMEEKSTDLDKAKDEMRERLEESFKDVREKAMDEVRRNLEEVQKKAIEEITRVADIRSTRNPMDFPKL